MRIKGLNGLRAIAALLVVFTHLGLLTVFQGSPLLPMIHGWAAVRLFFVLSGFLITHLLIIESNTFGSVSIKNFFIRRTLRIIPLYFLVIAFVTSVCLFIYPVSSWKGMLFAYSYTYNFIPRFWYSTQLGHLWTLAVEEHFYLIWPFLFYRYWKKDNGMVLMRICILSLIASILFSPAIHYISSIQNYFFIPRWTPSVSYNLLLGCICAIVINQKDRNEIYRKAVLFLGSRFAILLFLILWSNTLLGLAPGHLSTVLRGLSFAILISWIYLNQSCFLVKFLELPPLSYLGMISYGIYIYQGLFLATGPYRAEGQHWPPSPEVGLVLLILVVPLSYHLFESKLLKIGKQYRQKKGIDLLPENRAT